MQTRNHHRNCCAHKLKEKAANTTNSMNKHDNMLRFSDSRVTGAGLSLQLHNKQRVQNLTSWKPPLEATAGTPLRASWLLLQLQAQATANLEGTILLQLTWSGMPIAVARCCNLVEWNNLLRGGRCPMRRMMHQHLQDSPCASRASRDFR